MAVVCPGCGRQYDVTLFSFGRTIHCTCGTRVGLPPERDAAAGRRGGGGGERRSPGRAHASRAAPAAVGRERAGQAPSSPAPAPLFIADAMLGSLARWLRMLGFDVAYEAHIPDAYLVRRALEQHRVLLTRDRKLAQEWTVPQLYVVKAERTLAQVAEVLERFDLAAAARPFSRCSLCNAPLRAATGQEIAAKVPPYVRSTTDTFRTCPVCGRVYWRGTHTGNMLRALERFAGVSVGGG